MFGKHSKPNNDLSGQAQFDKLKEIISRLNVLIYKWNSAPIADNEFAELILSKLKTSRRILEGISIERSNSVIVRMCYISIIKNIEIFEQQHYSDEEIQSRLDVHTDIHDLEKAANDTLKISQQWEKCE